ncbi:hypothetical protein [Afifella aestuarii]|uniref:hypothetical protein n=1 Tax=Afifella aestuarii TaxID=1909496 RepID=UPI000FE31D92|nr:hypothetical protein [Afifella aestuarii]
MEKNGRPALCPSAQPQMPEAEVIGVQLSQEGVARTAYLNAHLPVTKDLLEQTAPLPPTQVLRFAARCEEARCRHFDGSDCRLARRIVGGLSPVVDALPACVIRRACRWFAQEGEAACRRCPQIATYMPERQGTIAELAEPELA